MKRIIALMAAACMMATLLTGCLFQSVEELYTLPKLSADYANLQDELGALINTGLEYAAPLTGDNAQSIQFQDLDQDGTDEVVAYFRATSGVKPIRIYIFRKTEEGLYENVAQIQGDGAAIHSVRYENMDDTQTAELLVNYQISDQVYSLHVYSLENYTPSELFSSGCSRYAASDLDQDGQCELVLFQTNDEGRRQAEYYDAASGTLRPQGIVQLSANLGVISRVRVRNLVGGQPAVYVTGEYSSNQARQITDILSVSQGELKNITLDESVGDSTATIRGLAGNIFATDINGDGILEIPFARELNQLEGQNVWLVRWQQYHPDGSSALACTTLWSPTDGWYLEVPEDWSDQISMQRETSTLSSEVAVKLYHFDGEEEITPESLGEDQQPFLTVYTLAGVRRAGQSSASGRVMLLVQNDLLCTAVINSDSWDCGLDETSLKTIFHQIPTDWSDSD